LLQEINQRLSHSPKFQNQLYTFLYAKTESEDCLLSDGAVLTKDSLCFPKGHLHEGQLTWKGFLTLLNHLSLYPEDPTRTVISRQNAGHPKPRPRDPEGNPYTPQAIYIQDSTDTQKWWNPYQKFSYEPEQLLRTICTYYLKTEHLALPHRQDSSEKLHLLEYIPLESSLGLTLSLDAFESVCLSVRRDVGHLSPQRQLESLWATLQEMNPEASLGSVPSSRSPEDTYYSFPPPDPNRFSGWILPQFDDG
jgi:hypothetical protein